MKDPEFIELLNLYVDHEITSVDAARLEAEVAQNPARARIYREYCGMQKACMILAEQFRGSAPELDAERIAADRSGSRRWALPFAAVGLAAAASLAVLLAVRRPASGDGAPSAALASAGVPASRPAVNAAPSPAFQPLFNLRLEPATGSGSALLASGDVQDSFAWMNQVQLAPIQRIPIEPLMFDPKGIQAAQGKPANVGPKATQGPVEMTAFRLQLDK